MAAAIKLQLKMAAGKISSTLKEKVEEYKDNVSNNDDERLIAINATILHVQHILHTLDTAMDTISDKLDDWAKLNSKMAKEEKIAAETEMMTTMSDLLIEAKLDAASEALDKLKVTERMLLKRKGQLELALSRASNQPQQHGQAAAQPGQSQPALKIRAPEWTLPTFDGKGSFNTFWTLFDTAIKSLNLTGIHNYIYLTGQFSGEAKALIEGIDMSSDSCYETAVKILKDRYGDKTRIIRSLYSELNGLRPCQTFKDVKEFQLQIEKICRQLESHGKDTDGEEIWIQLEQKLSFPLLKEMRRKRESNDLWTTSDFRKHLDVLVREQEEISVIYAQDHTPKNKQASPKSKDKKGKGPAEPSVTFAATEDQKKKGSKPEKAQDKNSNTGKPHGKGSSKDADPAPNSKGQKRQWCILCESETHFSDQCAKFQSVKERTARMNDLERCTRCVRKGHKAEDCKTRKLKSCFHCQGSHLSILCEEKHPKGTKQHKKGGEVTAPVMVKSRRALHKVLFCKEIELFNPENPNKSTRAKVFVDTGSMRSYIREEIARKLDLPITIKNERFGVTPFRAKESEQVIANSFKVAMVTKSNKRLVLEATGTPDILQKMPTIDEKEADEGETRLPVDMDEPDLLISIEYFPHLRIWPEKELPSGFWTYSSEIGPLIAGKGAICPSFRVACQVEEVAAVSIENPVDEDDPDFKELAKMYFLGQYGPRARRTPDEAQTQEEEDRILQQKFDKSVRFVDGKYEVGLLWREDKIPQLPTNYGLALGRLRSQYRKLKAKPELMAEYHRIMQDQLAKGIIEEVQGNKTEDRESGQDPEHVLHYLPHQGVVKESSASTKLRIVYDASSRVRKTLPSLNDCLFRGPLHNADIIAMLIRFRLMNTPVLGDLEKAFLQVKVREEDRDAMRLLWLRDINKGITEDNICTYRFAAATFGLKCSPSLLSMSVTNHLDKYQTGWKAAVAQKLKEGTYVDNFMFDANPKTVYQEIKLAQKIFSEGGFRFYQIATTDTAALAEIPVSEKAATLKSDTIKVLGHAWDLLKDKLEIQAHKPEGGDNEITNREVLSAIAKVYDPTGILSPMLLKAKLLLQKLWETAPEEGMRWNERLSESQAEEFKALVQNWTSISIPRCPFSFQNLKNCKVQLHVFSDASAVALGFAFYLRVQNEKATETALIFARSQVWPKTERQKQMNDEIRMPRMELQAAFNAAQWIPYFESEIRIKLEKIVLWTDSLAVIGWLKNAKWKGVFVENRVEQLQKYHIRHVPGDENPADLATRGMTGAELTIEGKQSVLWHEGPFWLKLEEDKWRPTKLFNRRVTSVYNPGEELKEDPDQQPFHIAAEAKVPKAWTLDHLRFSSLYKLKRAMVFILRYIELKVASKISEPKGMMSQIKSAVKVKGYIRAEEWALAEDLLIKEVQRNIPPDEKTTKNLNIQRDDQGLLRCYGRMQNSELPVEAINPIFLPNKAYFTKLVLDDYHAKLLHTGHKTTLANFRKKFWTPKGMQKLRSLKCGICQVHDAKPFKQLPFAPLPADRTSPSPPFTNIGVDYFGPCRVREGNNKAETRKVWVCIFVCKVTRAIHLELAPTCTTEDFYQAFRRFSATTHNVTKTIVSDNGPQFKAAAPFIQNSSRGGSQPDQSGPRTRGQLKRQQQEIQRKWNEVWSDAKTQDKMAEKGIKWDFIPEHAPARGGFYERLIALCKRCLRRSLGKSTLNEREFETFLKEVALVVNSRPLTHISDGDQLEPLTPAMLLCPYPHGKPQIEPDGEENPNDPDFKPGKKWPEIN